MRFRRSLGGEVPARPVAIRLVPLRPTEVHHAHPEVARRQSRRDRHSGDARRAGTRHPLGRGAFARRRELAARAPGRRGAGAAGRGRPRLPGHRGGGRRGQGVGLRRGAPRLRLPGREPGLRAPLRGGGDHLRGAVGGVAGAVRRQGAGAQPGRRPRRAGAARQRRRRRPRRGALLLRVPRRRRRDGDQGDRRRRRPRHAGGDGGGGDRGGLQPAPSPRRAPPSATTPSSSSG